MKNLQMIRQKKIHDKNRNTRMSTKKNPNQSVTMISLSLAVTDTFKQQ